MPVTLNIESMVHLCPDRKNVYRKKSCTSFVTYLQIAESRIDGRSDRSTRPNKVSVYSPRPHGAAESTSRDWPIYSHTDVRWGRFCKVIWSWNNFHGNSLPSADSRFKKGSCQFLGGLIRNSMDRLTDHTQNDLKSVKEPQNTNSATIIRYSCIDTYVHNCLKPLSNDWKLCSNNQIHIWIMKFKCCLNIVFTWKSSRQA